MKSFDLRHLVVIAMIGSIILMLGSSSDPLDGLTGAPGDSGACDIFCHSGDGSQQGFVQVLGFPAEIQPNATYPIEIRVTKSTGFARSGGFELTVLEGNSSTSESVGTWTNLGTNVQQSTNIANRTYLKHGPNEHQFTQNFPGAEVVSYTADWTAPPSMSDNIWVYAAANIAGPPAGTAGDRIVTTSVSNIPLPVELIHFEVSLNQNGLPLLEWATASENESAYFGIYRSRDGVTFTQIGKVDAAGYSQKILTYNFTDADPFTHRMSYYKLQLMDQDGQFHYSHIASVLVKQEQHPHLLLFPNPVRQGQCLFVECYFPEFTRPEIQFFNPSGEEITLPSLVDERVSGGYARIPFELGSLPPGVYLTRLFTGSAGVSQKFIVLE